MVAIRVVSTGRRSFRSSLFPYRLNPRRWCWWTAQTRPHSSRLIGEFKNTTRAARMQRMTPGLVPRRASLIGHGKRIKRQLHSQVPAAALTLCRRYKRRFDARDRALPSSRFWHRRLTGRFWYPPARARRLPSAGQDYGRPGRLRRLAGPAENRVGTEAAYAEQQRPTRVKKIGKMCWFSRNWRRSAHALSTPATGPCVF